MYTLKGIFPEPKKDPKRNFIKENMRQLKLVQGKVNQPRLPIRGMHAPRAIVTNHVKSSPSNRNNKPGTNIEKSSSRKKLHDILIKKGDMAEFLKRKEMLHSNDQLDDNEDNNDISSVESSGRLRDIGCQTVESNLAQQLADNVKLTTIYSKEDEMEGKSKASGDMARQKSQLSPTSHGHRNMIGDADLMNNEKNRSRLNAILDRKNKDNKDPYLPLGYQKGVLPKYLRERKESKEGEVAKPDESEPLCPPGHVTLPDTERKETLRMLRNSFAELVNELNKMPVKTDTLRMRNRKMELEKQLSKLEEGIKVFSRPRVFVKIGE